ncbi:MAG: exodeoxyribonuclease III [Cytophagales bacterium]|jgi:exodeoxyribonuclease-3|nr:exodeoxyribonuclease III [Cytophagales bacterium]
MKNYNIISWNVNGVRAIIKKDFLRDIKEIDPDVICLQETKAGYEDALKALEVMSGYNIYINSSKARKGYSGTAIISKIPPLKISNDIGIDEHDQEGRVIKAEFENFNLINVYVPNSGQELKRLDYRKKWDEEFLKFCLNSEKEKPTIITGDLNVAHKEIDIARPKPNYNKSAGYTQIEIDGINNFLNNNFIDIYRETNPDEIKYSWWNYRFRSRERNVGWRIDYFLVSTNLLNNVKETEIHNEYFGSDHCPVSLKLGF